MKECVSEGGDLTRKAVYLPLLIAAIFFAGLGAPGCSKDPLAGIPDDARTAVEKALDDVIEPFHESWNSALGSAQEVLIANHDGDLFFALIRHKEGFSRTILRKSQSEWKRLCGEGKEELNRWRDWGDAPGREVDVEVFNLFLEDGVTLIAAGWTSGLYPKVTVVFEEGSRTYEIPSDETTFCFVDRNTPGAAERVFALDSDGNQKDITGFSRNDYGGGIDNLW